MIEIGINSVSKSYAYQKILDGLDLEVMTGERVAIVGRNGAGKSTLFKLVARQENPDGGIVSVRKGAQVGMLEQIPTLPETDSTARDVLWSAFGEVHRLEGQMRNLEDEMATLADPDAMELAMKRYGRAQDAFAAVGGYEVQETVDKVIQGFGLSDMLDQPFALLSGGQKTIVNLAVTILRAPDILLLDEPTNHLDIRTLEWFEDFLTKYKGTVLIVSHDRHFLDKVANKTVLLEKGAATVFHGNYSFALREQERLLLLEFDQYKNQQKKIEAMKAAIRRFRDWGNRGDNEKFFKKAHMLERRLEKMEMLDRPQMAKPVIPLAFAGGRSGKEVLLLEDFSLAFGDRRLFDAAEMLLVEREKLCLMGDNGSGKTSLIKAILGENTDYTGTLQLGPSVRPGYIPQEIRFGEDRATVLEVFCREANCGEGRARGLLAKYFFYSDSVYKRARNLSGGEKVLLKLAILMQKEVNLLILDEPTNHIDIETREMLEEALLGYHGTLLFVSHDRYFISKVADRCLRLAGGKILPCEMPE